jgi:hypothetical protein
MQTRQADADDNTLLPGRSFFEGIDSKETPVEGMPPVERVGERFPGKEKRRRSPLRTVPLVPLEGIPQAAQPSAPAERVEEQQPFPQARIYDVRLEEGSTSDVETVLWSYEEEEEERGSYRRGGRRPRSTGEIRGARGARVIAVRRRARTGRQPITTPLALPYDRLRPELVVERQHDTLFLVLLAVLVISILGALLSGYLLSYHPGW